MIQGIDSVHESDMHRVTKCMHRHSGSHKTGSAAMASSAVKSQEAVTGEDEEQQGQFSLASWLSNARSGGKRLLQKIWGDGGRPAASGSPEDNGALTAAAEGTRKPGTAETAPAQDIALHMAQAVAGCAIAAPAMRGPQRELQDNPWFAIPAGEHRTVLQRARMRFQTAAGYLRQQFSGKNPFRAKEQKPRQDLRRHSRFRQDDLEVDCILTDDSYLLDSYDRHGEYSRLSIRK